jgi:mannose-6-phosphate isomerase
MSSLYPFIFKPILKSPLWGGQKLQYLLNKPSTIEGLSGESWEISGVKDNVSVVANGPLAGQLLTELIDSFGSELLGNNVYRQFGTNFPLLIKFIDANQDLSIQVHPNDELARKRHDSFGKTEMWYVVDAEKDATLISGFNRSTNKEEYLTYFNQGKLTDLLNKETVAPDDVFYLPAGRVHTIGKGLVIAEIQQTSDITYRIYDFDRVDKHGNKRELHVQEAVDAIDFNFYENYKTDYDKAAAQVNLVKSQYFITNRLLVEDQYQANYKDLDSFKILMVITGEGSLDSFSGTVDYKSGDTFLIPANHKELTIIATQSSKILEVYLP